MPRKTKRALLASLDVFTRSYLEGALYAELGDAGLPLDYDFGIQDFTRETIEQAIRDCTRFQEECAPLLMEAPTGQDAEQAGYDFWLTRNGHGAGFWDGDWGTVGDRLTEASERFGKVSVSAYRGFVSFV